MDKLKIICLTPVKNEAWILDRFLKCASLWADHIIIADQGSTDSSKDIALRYSKVTLINNTSTEFNESERQKLLIEEARKIKGRKLLITLDADEMLTANFRESCEWKTILNSQNGTVFQFQWINLMPDMKSCWIPEANFPWGFMDDGYSQHVGNDIHSTRIPRPKFALKINLREIKVLHYQYTDWDRMRSKHRWYQCFERINFENKSFIDIYRMYHHMDVIPVEQRSTIEVNWFKYYHNEGIDMFSVYVDREYWWDLEVFELFDKFGVNKFKRLDIWDKEWNFKKINNKHYICQNTFIDQCLLFFLKKTQVIKDCIFIVFLDKILKKIFI